jgi:glycosyltransferase involved in cell wall biosynthesis
MKVALVYDRVNKWGGAERVLLTLHEMFPDAPLYTSVYNPETAPWARVFPTVIPSFLNKVGFLRNRHELLAPLMPLAFERFNFNDYDLVISVSSEAAKGIITKPTTLHICYCLTPTRYLWSHYADYFKGATFKGIARPLVSYLKNWDKIAAQRPDEMIAISSEVQNRIKRYYSRDSEIIYPPVKIEKFKTAKTNPQLRTTNYYLVVSRLVPYKKVDLVVEAFNDLKLPLVIVGTGSEESGLKSKSKKNIIFKGYISDEELIGYYRQAKALIFPQEEDFGLVAVEAQAAGTPVIAYKRGGILDTLKDGTTGVFFEKQTKDALIKAVKIFEKVKFTKTHLINNAERFSEDIFKDNFLKLVRKLYTGLS